MKLKNSVLTVLFILLAATAVNGLLQWASTAAMLITGAKRDAPLSITANRSLQAAENKAVYTVPTISVGFNSIAWEGARFPLITAEEYRTSHTWVRDEYLKEYPNEDWQKNFVMLSTWNEYGEGTYIMPTSDEKGFGYVDIIRELYTDEKASDSVNTVPTAEQLVRINRLYPQYRRLLRKEGYYTVSLNEETLTEKMSLNLDPNQGNRRDLLGI